MSAPRRGRTRDDGYLDATDATVANVLLLAVQPLVAVAVWDLAARGEWPAAVAVGVANLLLARPVRREV